MPNHFLTVGLCARDYERLELSGKEDFDFSAINEMNLCEQICRLPDELEYIVASNPRCRYQHKVSGEYLKDCNGPMGNDRDQWDRVDIDKSEVESLIAKYGSADWYEWQTANWGTKWGTYKTKVHELGGDFSPVLIEFVTAWNPVSPEMMWKIDAFLCETFFLKNIKWIGHDPSDLTTVDIAVSREKESV